MLEKLTTALAERQAQGLYRQRRIVAGPQSVVQQIDGRTVLSFCSNDYLGLAADPRLAEALLRGVQQYGVGSGAAHLVTGHTAAHHALEEELAEFVGAERVLLFSTGYMANLGVLTALARAGDPIVQDRLNHASLLDGARLAGGRLHRYRHRDMTDVQRVLHKVTGRCLVVSDGVFSMDGDLAPLAELCQIAAQHQATLMIDDAHGFGVLGEQGRGSVRPGQVPIYVATLGKALGVAGAFVAGSAALIETLIQQARSYIYTTAMPAALAEAVRTSLQIVAQEQWRRDHLQALVQFFRHEAKRLGLPLLASDTPIQPIMLGSAEAANAWSEALYQQGILVTAIRPPTVPKGSARLRITFSAAHQMDQVAQLLTALQQSNRSKGG